MENQKGFWSGMIGSLYRSDMGHRKILSEQEPTTQTRYQIGASVGGIAKSGLNFLAPIGATYFASHDPAFQEAMHPVMMYAVVDTVARAINTGFSMVGAFSKDSAPSQKPLFMASGLEGTIKGMHDTTKMLYRANQFSSSSKNDK